MGVGTDSAMTFRMSVTMEGFWLTVCSLQASLENCGHLQCFARSFEQTVPSKMLIPMTLSRISGVEETPV